MSSKVIIPEPKGLKPPTTPLQSPPSLAYEGAITKDTTRSPNLSVNVILLAAILTLIFGLQGYMALPLPDPIPMYLEMMGIAPQTNAPQTISYTLQIPMCLFIGALLGAIPGATAMVVYIFLGLFFFPVFASGGGIQYVTEPGFGYLAGMIVGTVVCAKFFETVYKRPKKVFRSWSKLVLATIVGVLSIHGIGIAALTLFAFLGLHSFQAWTHWVIHLSAAPILFDLIITMFLLWLVRPLRYVLWPAIY